MNKTQIHAEIVGHSLSPQGDELISVLCTFPRIILAEVNTHRMLSKNTSSSRAIPFKKMVEAVQENPFIPIAWQKEHKGMQGNEYFKDKVNIETTDLGDLKIAWLEARDYAVKQATWLNKVGVTKQLCNRLLEPFMWTTMLITGPRSGWDNFFYLRCPQYEDTSRRIYKSRKDYISFANNRNKEDFEEYSDLKWLQINKGQAEIHIMDLAEKIYDAVNGSTPKQLQSGEWHIPFEDKIGEITFVPISKDDPNFKIVLQGTQVMVSTAMAARTSYTVVGEEKDINYQKMIDLHDRLISQEPPHSSPLEHCARAMTYEEYNLFNKGEATDHGYDGGLMFNKEDQGWCNNFKGFIPYRYMIDNKLKI